mgnify:CR=1 FL=1
MWSGQARKSTSFLCLVSTNTKESDYCLGEVKQTKDVKRNMLDDMLAKFKEDKCWTLSKPVLFEKALKYINTPLKFVVDMRSSMFSPLLACSPWIKPMPQLLLTDCVAFKQEQSFDVVAVVMEVSSTRTTKQAGRVIADVKLMDGSKNSAGKMQEISVSIFAEARGSKEPAIFDQLRAFSEDSTKQPIVLYGLTGKSESGIYAFSSARHCILEEAAGARAEEVRSMIPTLSALGAEDKETLRSQTSEARDYSTEPAQLVFVALLDAMKQRLGLDGMDDKNSKTLWLVNWVELQIAEANNFLDSSRSRIWFPVSLRDWTQQTTLYIREKAALQLTGLTKDEFLIAAADGTLEFPPLCSVRALRTLREQSPNASTDASSSSTALGDQVSLVIVEAGEQDLSEAFTQSALPLIDILRKRPSLQSSSTMLASTLAMLRTSETYSLAVQYGDAEAPMPCKKAVVLISSTRPSKLDKIGEQGYFLTTPGVKDLLQESGSDYIARSICTLENLPRSKLDAPKTGDKTQRALIVITGLLDKTLMVESVQLLSKEDAAKATEALKQMMFMAKSGVPATSQDADWSTLPSPTSASKCRRLSRSPTDVPMQMIDFEGV